MIFPIRLRGKSYLVRAASEEEAGTKLIKAVVPEDEWPLMTLPENMMRVLLCCDDPDSQGEWLMEAMPNDICVLVPV